MENQSPFQKNSAFNPESPHHHALSLRPYDPVVGSTRKLGVTEVENQILEEWYSTLDGLTRDPGNADEVIEELRDHVHSYLRG